MGTGYHHLTAAERTTLMVMRAEGRSLLRQRYSSSPARNSLQRCNSSPASMWHVWRNASLIAATRVDLVRSFVMERFLSMDITGRCRRRRLVGDKEMQVERCIEQ